MSLKERLEEMTKPHPRESAHVGKDDARKVLALIAAVRKYAYRVEPWSIQQTSAARDELATALAAMEAE